MKYLALFLRFVLLISIVFNVSILTTTETVRATTMTVVNIDASATQVSSGDPVVLTITESNTGVVPLTNVSLSLYDGTTYLSPVLVDDGNGDDVLDAGEVWQWEITVYPLESTKYEAKGYGFYKNPDTGEEYHITPPAYPSEYDYVEVWILDYIVISPATSTISAGDDQTYTAEAFDSNNNSLGDVTSSTDFSIEPGAGGSWAANVYTSERYRLPYR
jgi:uncharacterized repeat protein (TIGR01451 family)